MSDLTLRIAVLRVVLQSCLASLYLEPLRISLVAIAGIPPNLSMDLRQDLSSDECRAFGSRAIE